MAAQEAPSGVVELCAEQPTQTGKGGLTQSCPAAPVHRDLLALFSESVLSQAALACCASLAGSLWADKERRL